VEFPGGNKAEKTVGGKRTIFVAFFEETDNVVGQTDDGGEKGKKKKHVPAVIFLLGLWLWSTGKTVPR